MAPERGLGFPARAAVKANSRPKQRIMLSACAKMSVGICRHGIGLKRSTWFHVSLRGASGAQEESRNFEAIYTRAAGGLVVLWARHLQFKDISRLQLSTYTSVKFCRCCCEREQSLCCRRVVTAGHF
jgi:hypothetical protein